MKQDEAGKGANLLRYCVLVLQRFQCRRSRIWSEKFLTCTCTFDRQWRFARHKFNFKDLVVICNSSQDTPVSRYRPLHPPTPSHRSFSYRRSASDFSTYHVDAFTHLGHSLSSIREAVIRFHQAKAMQGATLFSSKLYKSMKFNRSPMSSDVHWRGR